ncbi:MAG: hypothetical protein AAB970_00550 [Patescibacteria group bacterium]
MTIPKSLIKNDDLIVLPRKLYESLLRAQNNNIVVKRSASFKIKKGQEKFYNKLDKDLTQTLREVKQGKVIGPFDNVKDLMKSLNS